MAWLVGRPAVGGILSLAFPSKVVTRFPALGMCYLLYCSTLMTRLVQFDSL
jgi:hypothetical protein